MSFVKWPSIENTYQQKFIDVFLAEFPELADEIFVITEKLHGSNLQLLVSPSEPVRAGSRNRYLSPDERFQKVLVSDMLEWYAGVLRGLQELADATGNTYRLFGELIGPGIQKGVDYGKEYRILFFGLMVNDILQPFAFLQGVVSNFVPVVALVEGLQAALDFDTNFLSILNSVNGNICEGVVIQPYSAVCRNEGGHTFLFKKKNEAFKEKASAKKPPSPGDPEVARLNAEFRSYLTDQRLQGIFSKHGEIEEPIQIGQYIRLMISDAREDFLKDFGDDFDKLTKSEQKQVLNIGSLIAHMLKSYL